MHAASRRAMLSLPSATLSAYLLNRVALGASTGLPSSPIATWGVAALIGLALCVALGTAVGTEGAEDTEEGPPAWARGALVFGGAYLIAMLVALLGGLVAWRSVATVVALAAALGAASALVLRQTGTGAD